MNSGSIPYGPILMSIDAFVILTTFFLHYQLAASYVSTTAHDAFVSQPCFCLDPNHGILHIGIGRPTWVSSIGHLHCGIRALSHRLGRCKKLFCHCFDPLATICSEERSLEDRPKCQIDRFLLTCLIEIGPPFSFFTTLILKNLQFS